MAIVSRAYKKEKDYQRISDFLGRMYTDKKTNQNWLQPRWEYMHYHPYFYRPSVQKELDKIRIWEDDGKIAAVAHFELMLVDCYIELDPEYSYLKQEIAEYAEENLRGEYNGKTLVAAYVNENDEEFKEIFKARGFKHEAMHDEYMSVFKLDKALPKITLPEGFRLQSLADENDLIKVDRVLWRGFNHDGEPDSDLSGRKLMQSAPNYNKSINIVVVAPDDTYVSYCGMWYDEVNKVAYVEPVATDPDYRKMGLGKAAVLEGVRRCKELGATKAYVGSSKQFYMNIGFEIDFRLEAWVKFFD